ncbi:hypothetical protein C7974DRAFT_412898 [Boeremia exigua]|uniref:uncharacterized protein n=1 Tax=Boeremia exigua TaxID=749465 RepID=UPI001E8D29E7|nr:uncharacterized protein C7974DRAFT_412898 [Boeremia exigua]KAH6629073.1 hypothetical protein C7974DRAFT_412898 [Boeremia exigua]
MNLRSSSPLERHGVSKADEEEPPSMIQSQEQQPDPESSSDDIPLRQQRPVRPSTHERESTSSRCHLQRHARESSDTSALSQRRAAHQATLRQPAKAPVTAISKPHKKPGPRPWASKPIKKNDMEAKKEVIREIEQYWGKGFIRAYVPKCHRPLMKRGDKGGKRTMYRDHEADPKKWLPSVLKSILSIAKLTQSKEWLKKAMNDVVRYRIKNTGNRKPQLVTTDFDVLEDMLIKDWDVPYSFSIRYKHLLVNRQGQQETDKDIDHILGVGSDNEAVSGDESDDVEDDNARDQDEFIKDEDADDSDAETDRGGLTGQYFHRSGYTSSPRPPPPFRLPGLPPQKHKVKDENSSKRDSEPPSRPQPPRRKRDDHSSYPYPYPYGAPMDPWGRPMPYGGPEAYGGYGGYGMYGSYGSYAHGPPPSSDSRPPSQPGGYPSMPRYPRHGSHAPNPPRSPYDTDPRSPTLPPADTKRPRTDYDYDVAPHTPRPGFHTYYPPPHAQWPRDPAQGYPQPLLQNCQGQDASFAVKQEPSRTPTPNADAAAHGVGEDSCAAALEAELRATELELKVARLQARREASRAT